MNTWRSCRDFLIKPLYTLIQRLKILQQNGCVKFYVYGGQLFAPSAQIKVS